MIPTFSECDHSIIQHLIHSSDRELVHLFQKYRQKGQYFVAIFCRYSHLVYSLMNGFLDWQSLAPHNWSAINRRSSPVQTEYLFAKSWRHIFQNLKTLDLKAESVFIPKLSTDIKGNSGSEVSSEVSVENASLQNWILNTTAAYVNQTELLPVEAIHYSLSAASPPLWCYLEEALDRLPTTMRLMVIMAQTFHWSETRIAAYLQAEGETISAPEVQGQLQTGYQLLETLLPDDIREIYLGCVATSKAALS